MRIPYRTTTRRFSPTKTMSPSGSLPSVFRTGQRVYNTYKKYRNNPTTGPIVRMGESYVRAKLGKFVPPMARAMKLTKMRFSTYTATPGEISYSSFKLGKYRPAYFKSAIKTAQRFNYNESGSAHTTFIAGNQGVNDLYIMDGPRMFDLAMEARSAYGDAPASDDNNYNVWFGTIKTTVRFSNPGLSSLSVDIYNYDCRRDLNDFNVNGPTTLAQSWTFGASYENIAGTYGTDRLGASPLDVGIVGKYWKIRKKTTVQLPPGAEHIHVITYNINRLYSSIMDVNIKSAQISSAHVGFTHGLLIVPSGAVVYDDNNPAQVDTAGGALNFVYDTSYEIFNHTGQQNLVKYVDNTGVVTSPKIVVVQNPTAITP